MGDFVQALFWAAVVIVPIVLLLKNDYGKKRGCGRGCSSCGNRAICWRGQETENKPKEQEKYDD